MTVNGVELKFSLFNPDHVQKYHDAEKALGKSYETATDKKYKDDVEGYIQALRDACGVVFDFFDNAFGDGTANRVFGAETDLEVCTEAFEEIGIQMELQAEKMGDKLARYSEPTK